MVSIQPLSCTNHFIEAYLSFKEI